MAAQKNAFAIAPWTLKKNEINDFIRVTEINRNHARVIGRIMYVIEQVGHHYIYQGCFTIDPCYFKGWWQWPYLPFAKRDKEFQSRTHWRVYMECDKSREEWASDYRSLLDRHIQKEQLYIKQSDPILTYIKE